MQHRHADNHSYLFIVKQADHADVGVRVQRGIGTRVYQALQDTWKRSEDISDTIFVKYIYHITVQNIKCITFHIMHSVHIFQTTS